MARGQSHWWNEPPWWAWVAIVVGAVVLAVGLPYAMSREPVDSVSQTELDRMDAAIAAAAAEDEASRPLELAILGDSYTAGAGADNRGSGYAPQVIEQAGFTGDLFAAGGTGYTRGDDDGGPFLDRVAPLVESQADVVLVQGSTNDYQASAAAITDAAGAVFDAIRAGLPEAKIFALGALSTPQSPEPGVQKARDAVRAAAEARGIQFIDPTGWINPDDPAMWDDGYHPSQQGHDAIAAQLAPLLTAAAGG